MPYVVTIIGDMERFLVFVARNYEEADMMKSAINILLHLKFLPGLGSYGLGLTHMGGGLAQASTSILRPVD